MKQEIGNPQMQVIALANQKGGVGKTTTAVNLAGELARRNQRVLLIDCDPQGNATTSLGIAKRDLKATTYEVLMGLSSAEEVIQPTSRASYDIIPASEQGPGGGNTYTVTNLVLDPTFVQDPFKTLVLILSMEQPVMIGLFQKEV